MTREEAIDKVYGMSGTKEQKPAVTHGETYHVDTLGTQQVIAGKMPQKPAEWSEEDSDNLERLDNYLWMLDNYVGDDCAMPQGKADKIRGNIQDVLSPWLKSLPERKNLQPKQEWSEEDEEIIDTIVSVLGQYIDYKTVSGTSSGYATPRYNKEIDWLKSIPLNLKNKNEDVAKLCSNEWSEEDEGKLKAICTYLRDYSRLAKLGDKLRFNEYCDFLQSLRPSWKPSEEQITAVEAAYSALNSHDSWGEDEHLPILMSLINDLQKLL